MLWQWVLVSTMTLTLPDSSQMTQYRLLVNTQLEYDTLRCETATVQAQLADVIASITGG